MGLPTRLELFGTANVEPAIGCVEKLVDARLEGVAFVVELHVLSIAHEGTFVDLQGPGFSCDPLEVGSGHVLDPHLLDDGFNGGSLSLDFVLKVLGSHDSIGNGFHLFRCCLEFDNGLGSCEIGNQGSEKELACCREFVVAHHFALVAHFEICGQV